MKPQQPAAPLPDPADSVRPIAYDAEGRPLYNAPVQQHPPAVPQSPQTDSHVTTQPDAHSGHSFDPRLRTQYANEPGVVHAVREVEPEKREISPELRQKHQAAKQRYPHLNLSEGEVVILDIKRHPIGLAIPLLGGGMVLAVFLVALILYPADAELSGLPSYGLFALIAGLCMLLAGIGTFIAVWVYLQNQFYMTNESVIQEIQHSLFSRHEQTVSLGSIEDASFRQTGILQTMLNYGTIRLSTEGEETTYRFAYVANPRDQVAVLNNGVEAFKNGRPVELSSHDN